MSLSLMRALRQLGFDAERIGEPNLNEGDGHRHAVLLMTVNRTMPHIPKATHPPRFMRRQSCKRKWPANLLAGHTSY